MYILFSIPPLVQPFLTPFYLRIPANSRALARLSLKIWLFGRMIVSSLVFVWRRRGLVIGVLRIGADFCIWCG